jgi:site-specific recombinase XerD
MPLKKNKFAEEEIPIYDEAIVYRRGRYWQFRMWIEKEKKYVRKSLRTKNKETAIEKGKENYLEIFGNVKAGKSYFSLTTKEGVALYIQHREKDLEVGIIVAGRLSTIKTHLEHWLKFIKKDTKLKELHRTDCENYFHERFKSNKRLPISQTTILNEQSTINAMMKYLYRYNETLIDSFDFKKLKRIDRGLDEYRRSSFTPTEIGEVEVAIHEYYKKAWKNLDDEENLKIYITCYYFLFAMVSGLRTGEQRQLRWTDVGWTEHKRKTDEVSLIKITVRAETTKVRKTRSFMIRDKGYLEELRSVLWKKQKQPIATNFIFSTDGSTVITERLILYHFYKILELAEIKNLSSRSLVPYSFRHHFITQRIMSGLSYRQISDMCGTSPSQIDRTYYHVNEEIMRTNAMAGYKLSEDGIIEPEE